MRIHVTSLEIKTSNKFTTTSQTTCTSNIGTMYSFVGGGRGEGGEGVCSKEVYYSELMVHVYAIQYNYSHAEQQGELY